MSDPLASLRERFRARCAEDLLAIRALSGDEARASMLGALCHKLAGVAGSFGRRDISQAASEIDVEISAGRWPVAAPLARLIMLLESEARPKVADE